MIRFFDHCDFLLCKLQTQLHFTCLTRNFRQGSFGQSGCKMYGCMKKIENHCSNTNRKKL